MFALLPLLQLKLERNFYLFDAYAGGEAYGKLIAKEIIAASPDANCYKQAKKAPAFTRFYMPLRTLDELQLCRQHCYPTGDEDVT